MNHLSISDEDIGKVCLLWLALEQHLRVMAPEEVRKGKIVDCINLSKLTEADRQQIHKFRQSRNMLIHALTSPLEIDDFLELGYRCRSILESNFKDFKFTPSGNEPVNYGRVAKAWFAVEEELKRLTPTLPEDSTPELRIANLAKALPANTIVELDHLRLARNAVLHNDIWLTDALSFVSRAEKVVKRVRSDVDAAQRRKQRENLLIDQFEDALSTVSSLLNYVRLSIMLRRMREGYVKEFDTPAYIRIAKWQGMGLEERVNYLMPWLPSAVMNPVSNVVWDLRLLPGRAASFAEKLERVRKLIEVLVPLSYGRF